MAAPQHSSNATIIPGVSQNMSLKIGRNAAELSKPCFTAGSSRVSRSRAAKALGLRNNKRKQQSVSPQSPPSPNQESAMNPRTGKVAFGPWQGPYETHADTAAATSGPLFLDKNGNTYASLNSPTHLKGVSSPPAPQPAGGKAPAAAAATQQLYAMVSKAASAAVKAAAPTRAPAQWQARGKPHGSGRCGSANVRSINQPRRS